MCVPPTLKECRLYHVLLVRKGVFFPYFESHELRFGDIFIPGIDRSALTDRKDPRFNLGIHEINECY